MIPDHFSPIHPLSKASYIFVMYQWQKPISKTQQDLNNSSPVKL